MVLTVGDGSWLSFESLVSTMGLKSSGSYGEEVKLGTVASSGL